MATVEDHPKTPPRLFPSVRLTVTLLICFGLFNQYAQRFSMSIAIVCMVNRTELTDHNNTPPTAVGKIGTKLLQEKQFRWTELEQQLILGAYWAGYIVTLVPGSD